MVTVDLLQFVSVFLVWGSPKLVPKMLLQAVQEGENKFLHVLATVLEVQPSLQLLLKCRLLKPVDLVYCEGLWGAGAAQRAVLCLSLALGTGGMGLSIHTGQGSSSAPAPSAALPQGSLGRWGWTWGC